MSSLGQVINVLSRTHFIIVLIKVGRSKKRDYMLRSLGNRLECWPDGWIGLRYKRLWSIRVNCARAVVKQTM